MSELDNAMHPLDRDLRRHLESTVKAARDIAERAARSLLEQLGVERAAAFSYLSERQRALRRRLRSHGRQLGDRRDPSTEAQAIDLLVQEVAYQHWHRMLFARWLAESHLLMYPDPVTPIAVTLAECAELAADPDLAQGAVDAWDLAARFASQMLPQIFRPASPVFQLTLPTEAQQALEGLVEGLDPAVFHSSDGLGWVYQFWQSRRKEEVNAAEVKIGASELPAVTQLFTEPYMVRFLLDNALGAWWVGQRCGAAKGQGTLTASEQAAQGLLRTASSEEELRACFSLPGVPLTSLRFVRDSQESEFGETRFLWRPAAGWFAGWPQTLAELKVLDPCCGSGHFLVAIFWMLVPMRMALEGLEAREAVDAVLGQNLHGLELDARCVEIAAFALALAAWRYPGAGGYRPLPPLKLACCGLAVAAKKEEWLAVAEQAADALLAEQTPSPLPDIGKESLWHTQLKAGMGALHDLFQNAPVLGSLINPNRMAGDFFRADYAQVADLLRQTLADDTGIPPTVGEGEDASIPPTVGEGDIYELGVAAQGLAEAATLLAGRYHWVVTNVPYLTRGKQDKPLRDFCEAAYPEAKQDLATVFLERCLEFCGTGGAASTVLPQNWLFLSSYKKLREKLLKGETWQLLARLGEGGFDSSAAAGAFTVLLSLGHGRAPDGQALCGLDVSAPRAVAEKAAGLIEGEIAQVGQAQQLGNPNQSIGFEDLSSSILLEKFALCIQGISTGDNPRFVYNFWEKNNIQPWEYLESSPESIQEFQGKTQCIDWIGVTESESSAIRGYEAFGRHGVGIGQMRQLPATLYLGYRFPNSSPVIIPIKSEHLPAIWTLCQSETFAHELRKINQKLSVDNGYITKVPFDLDHWSRVAAERYPDGLPKPYSPDPTQWIFHGHPADSTAPLQVAVARLLGYRWPAESDRSMELSDAARVWVERSAALLPFADTDGIVCLPPVCGELAAADRLTGLLAAAYGDTWRASKLDGLLAAAGWAGKSLDSWLRTQFFVDHCKLFHHRPFLWHVWDGLPDGFASLVNYHQLDRKRLEMLIYTYMGDWISRQKHDMAAGVDGAQAKLAAAETLQKRLELILYGEAPYDIFVRWKPLDQQPIGWEPDLNDGVRLNIRPWLSVPAVGKKGAGVLRDRPNLHWEKDRGKDVASAPWYGLFGGERINDHHLTLAEKMRARGAASEYK